ncbi:YecR family lipoprotein [Pseudothauera rhizosphaerae]|uniref:Lipoprotein n=1 Tax=Pseudothauera rhizosphaerae TaxID=2565932 RepID=A0A4V3WBS4_9RHOO|nr:YecR family lipoprotein [Pseudothauera rhizosphaerae]THF64346.1 hypothetical protein E6O51_03280 [Pseudothauera rhizosphaerae]
MARTAGLLSAALLAALTSACSTTEKMRWVAVGGSKADGAVILGIDVPAKMGVRETLVEWDEHQANAEAERRCKNWGYTGAETFRDDFPVQVVCHAQGISPCWSKTYRIVYQCVGEAKSAPRLPPVPSSGSPKPAQIDYF